MNTESHDVGESVERPIRHYVEFADPASDLTVRADLTWLTSRWHCIFGDGCPGIDASRPAAGCCALGAHFTDADDENRVRSAVQRLTAETWQHHADGADGAWVETDEDGDRTTVTTPAGCVFLNEPDFPAGGGCALHLLALAEGIQPLSVKPDVCWQLPLRRSYRTITEPDGATHLELSIDEYDRRAWGPGGADLDWYCTASPAALGAALPLYRSAAAELTELIGPDAYELLASQCACHEEKTTS